MKRDEHRSRHNIAIAIGLCALLGYALMPARTAFASAGTRGIAAVTPDRFVSCPRLNTGSAVPYVAYQAVKYEVHRAAIGSRRLHDGRRICWLGYSGSRIRALRSRSGQTARWSVQDRLLHRSGASLHR
jgi:hypothetical protein